MRNRLNKKREWSVWGIFTTAFLGLSTACVMELDSIDQGGEVQSDQTARKKIQVDDSELGSDQFLAEDLPMVEVETDPTGPLTADKNSTEVTVKVSNTEYFAVGNMRLVMPEDSVMVEKNFEDQCGDEKELLEGDFEQSPTCRFELLYNKQRALKKHGRFPNRKKSEAFTIEYDALPRFQEDDTELETYGLSFSVSFIPPTLADEGISSPTRSGSFNSSGRPDADADSRPREVKQVPQPRPTRVIRRAMDGRKVNPAKEVAGPMDLIGGGVTTQEREISPRKIRSGNPVVGRPGPAERRQSASRPSAF